MLKPNDFFVGVVDFFAILLPGSILVFAWATNGPADSSRAALIEPLTGSEAAFAFFVGAYIVGHMAAATSGPLDHLADWAAARFEPTHAKELERYAHREISTRLDNSAAFSTKLGFVATYVRLHSSVAAAEIDRLQAVSRFFRSLVVVIVALMLFEARFYEFIPTIFAVLTLPLVIFLFGYQRWKRRLAVYTGFVTLVCWQEPGKA